MNATKDNAALIAAEVGVQIIIGIITGLLVAAIWAVGSYLFRHRNPIVVFPRSLKVLRRNREARLRFTIHNRFHETFYSIIVKLTIGQTGIQSDEIEVDPIWKGQTQESRINDILVRTDIFRIDCTDNRDREAILLFIRSLLPKETLSFAFTSRSYQSSGATQQANISIQVVDFRREPSPILEGPHGLALPFTPAENIRVKRIRLLMKRQS